VMTLRQIMRRRGACEQLSKTNNSLRLIPFFIASVKRVEVTIGDHDHNRLRRILPRSRAPLKTADGGHDPGVCADSLGAVGHWLLGYPEKALAIGSQALALAERIAHPFSLGLALLFNWDATPRLRRAAIGTATARSGRGASF
jgi:hypothetical protein